MGLRAVEAVESAVGKGQDRAEFFHCGEAVVAVVADGAGGVSGGAEAADLVVEAVRQAVGAERDSVDPRLWCRLLHRIDLEIAADPRAGLTTAVVAACAPGRVAGAAVGDSGCWLLTAGSRRRLTRGVPPKPLIGSGECVCGPFEADFPAGTLLVASDGLLKYARRDRIAAAAMHDDLDLALRTLIDLARLPGGALQDDASVVLVRNAGG